MFGIGKQKKREIKTGVKIPEPTASDRRALEYACEYSRHPGGRVREVVEQNSVWALHEILQDPGVSIPGDLDRAMEILPFYHDAPELMQMMIDVGGTAHLRDSEVIENAASHDRVKTLNVLIAAGADPRVYGDNPLRNAAARGSAGTVRVLLENGADPKVNKYEPLRAALQRENTEMVDLLLARTGRDLDLDVVLEQSFAEGQFKAMTWAIDKGGDFSKIDAEKLRKQFMSCDTELIETLEKKCGVEVPAVELAAYAVEQGQQKRVRWALEKYADAIDANALLNAAVAKDSTNMVETLLECGAVPTAETVVAALTCRERTGEDQDQFKARVKPLLDKCPDPCASDSIVLLTAAENGRKDSMAYMLKQFDGWDAPAIDKALVTAVDRDMPGTTRSILENAGDKISGAAINQSLHLVKRKETKALLEERKKQMLGHGWDITTDYEICRSTQYGDGLGIKHIFNFRACQVKTVTTTKDPASVTVETQNFSDFQSDSELREAHRLLSAFSNDPPEYIGQNFKPVAGKRVANTKLNLGK